MLRSITSSGHKQNLSKELQSANQAFSALHSAIPFTGFTFLMAIEVSEVIYIKSNSNPHPTNLVCLILNMIFLVFQSILIVIWRRQLCTEKTRERLTIILYSSILFTNIELIWIKATEILAASIICSIYLGMIFPITFFLCKAEKIIQWAIPTIYFCVCLYRNCTEENGLFLGLIGILFVGLGISLVIVSEYIRSVANFLIDWEKKANNSDKQVCDFFLDESDNGIIVLDRKFRIKKSNQKFFEFFGQAVEASGNKLTTLLTEVTNIGCYDELCDMIGKLSQNDNNGNESSMKFPIRQNSSPNLHTFISLLFENPTGLKKMKVGWNVDKNRPSLYKTSGIHENTNLIISFAFIAQDNGEDLVLLKLAHRSNESDSTTTLLSVRDIASIIHDLRTPIYASTAMLQNAIDVNRVSQDIAEEVIIPSMNCNQRLLFIVNDILDLAQILEGKFRLSYQSVELRKLLQEPIKLIDALARLKNIKIFLEIKEDVPVFVNTDPNRLIQIIYNLMGNSLKFTKEGFVKLCVSCSEHKYIDFSVEDTGTGIKQEDLRKLFTAFEKLSELNENVIGVGLGLCISNSIASALGKKISVKSEYGEGSIFYFSILNPDLKSDGSAGSSGSAATTTTTGLLLSPQMKRRSKFSSDDLQYQKESRKFSEDIKKLIIDSRKESNEADIGPIRDPIFNKTFYCDYHPSLKSIQSSKSISKTDMLDPISDQKPKMKKNLEIKRSDSDIPLLQVMDQTMAMSSTSECLCPQVIVVDDEFFNVTVFELLMKQIGVRGIKFTSGEDFLNYIKQNKVHCEKCTGPYFILMDQHMPLKDGYETSKEFLDYSEKNHLNPIPIVGCSANEDEDWKMKMDEIGVKNFAKKPLNKVKMERLVEKYKVLKDAGSLLKFTQKASE